MSRSRRPVKPWREFVRSLNQEQRDKILFALLERQIDELGYDGDVNFREADAEGGVEACIYWTSCGDSLIDEEAT